MPNIGIYQIGNRHIVPDSDCVYFNIHEFTVDTELATLVIHENIAILFAYKYFRVSNYRNTGIYGLSFRDIDLGFVPQETNNRIHNMINDWNDEDNQQLLVDFIAYTDVICAKMYKLASYFE